MSIAPQAVSAPNRRPYSICPDVRFLSSVCQKNDMHLGRRRGTALKIFLFPPATGETNLNPCNSPTPILEPLIHSFQQSKSLWNLEVFEGEIQLLRKIVRIGIEFS